MAEKIYKIKPEVWDEKKCRRASRRTAKDGLGTPYHFKGYIGSLFGVIRYNGGCIREGEWYNGEDRPLPIVAEGYEIVHVPTWGWQIRLCKPVQEQKMSCPVILAMNTQYGLLGVRSLKDYKGAEYPFPNGWKELLDTKLEFEQVNAEFPSEEMANAFIQRFKDTEPHWVPDTPEEAVKDAQITVLYYFDDVFRKYFTSPYEQYEDRIGQEFTVLGHDLQAEQESKDAAGFEDHEKGESIYNIRFNDGVEIVADGHEVCVLDRPKCKGRTYETPVWE